MSRKLINGLTAKQLEELRTVLQTKHDELIKTITMRKENSPKVDPSENIEEMDQATNSAAQAVQLRILDKESKLLREINRALGKFESNEYGLCEGTDEPIGYARLKARPWTRYSITYKEELERVERQQSERLPGR